MIEIVGVPAPGAVSQTSRPSGVQAAASIPSYTIGNPGRFCIACWNQPDIGSKRSLKRNWPFQCGRKAESWPHVCVTLVILDAFPSEYFNRHT
jgi:hypothetical protein